jgi:hypothetical protein
VAARKDETMTPAWPPLPLAEWQDTRDTLHLWTQIVGKIRMARAPMLNHWWQVTLYVTARGLTTSPIPAGTRTFEIRFDFIDHQLLIETSEGEVRALALRPRSVADFYQETMGALRSLGLETPIRTVPSEIENPIPFDEDRTHASYDADAAQRFWQVLVQSDRLLTRFRSSFLGKASPVHFFWGGFDMAVTRFSGRLAPPHPGGFPGFPDWAVRESYSHEVSSCGFWAGGPPGTEAVYYAYAYPEPEGFASMPAGPRQAFYSNEMKEFLLPYEAVRTADSPDDVLLEFLQKTFEAAAERGGWDRAALERRTEARQSVRSR